MTERHDVKDEERCRAQLHQILDLVMDINGTEARRQELTGELPTAFMRFSGQTAEVSVTVCKNGWGQGMLNADFADMDVYLKDEDGTDEVIRWLTEIKDEAQGAATPRASD